MLRIPAEPDGPKLLVTLLRPDGAGPFPLAVMNHGASAGVTDAATRYRDTFAAYYFLSRGYAVALPMMRGYAGSEGSLHPSGCDAQGLGEDDARDIANVIGELGRRPDLDPTRIVVAGQSFGGWNTLALGSMSVPGLKGLVDFNGGVNMSRCDRMKDSLVSGAKAFAARTTVPSLWFYGDTDSEFPPGTWRAMYAAYNRKGGLAELVDVGSAFTDSHQFLVDPEAQAVWMPRLDTFLARIGLPSAIVFPDYLPPEYPKPSGFAAVGDLDKVPYLTDKGRLFYQDWLKHPTPRVLAISPSGKMTSTYGGFDPATKALRTCMGTDGAMCRLYAIDDAVVWRPLPPTPPTTNAAAISDATAIPYLGPTKTAFLQRFLSRPAPRALVISKDGRAFGRYGPHAFDQAWVNCTAVAKACEPYIVDDAVVWKAGLYADVAGPGFHTRLRGPELPFQITASNSTVSMAGARATDEASARRLGEVILRSPIVAAAWENTPEGGLTTLKHKASGLVCRDARVVVFSPVANEAAFAPAAVSDCVARASGLQSDLSITRRPAGMDGARALAVVVDQAEREEKGVNFEATVDARHASLRSKTTPLFLAVALAVDGDWIVWEKVRADLGHAADADRVADTQLEAALRDLDAGKAGTMSASAATSTGKP